MADKIIIMTIRKMEEFWNQLSRMLKDGFQEKEKFMILSLCICLLNERTL